MKTYSAKTVQEAIELACLDLGVTPEELSYEVLLEKKGLFSKKAEIEVYTTQMIIEYIESYVRRILTNMEFEVEVVSYIQDDRIFCNINTDNNSILIGKGGVILRALNFIVRNAVSLNFKKRIELSLDINGYRENRHKKVAGLAKKLGKSVQKNKIEIRLDPMPADERKVIHQVIAEMDHLRTESKGEGKDRYLTIYYDEDK